MPRILAGFCRYSKHSANKHMDFNYVNGLCDKLSVVMRESRWTFCVCLQYTMKNLNTKLRYWNFLLRCCLFLKVPNFMCTEL